MMTKTAQQQQTDDNAFRAWRKALGVDIATAAQMLGKTRRTVEYYEAGREPPVETLKFMRLIAETGRRDLAPWGRP